MEQLDISQSVKQQRCATNEVRFGRCHSDVSQLISGSSQCEKMDTFELYLFLAHVHYYHH